MSVKAAYEFLREFGGYEYRKGDEEMHDRAESALNDFYLYCESELVAARLPWISMKRGYPKWDSGPSNKILDSFWAPFYRNNNMYNGTSKLDDDVCSISFCIEKFSGEYKFVVKFEIDYNKIKKTNDWKALARFNDVAERDFRLDCVEYIVYPKFGVADWNGKVLCGSLVEASEKFESLKEKHKRICPAVVIATGDEMESDRDYNADINSAIKKINEYFEAYYDSLMKERTANDGVEEITGNGKAVGIPKNMILYGPPGTGKTYSTVLRALEIINGRKPGDYKDTSYADYESKMLPLYNKYLDNGRIRFVTFHQSYGYEEFIEGIRPSTDVNGNISYEVKPGVFKKFCDDARKGMGEDKDGSKDVPYVFIIDEINRGNISKIFGELITLIEDDKREGASEGTSALLPYPKKDENGKETEDCFSVPRNVYIIGTMNTADRSITSLDTALRRRFDFEEVMPDPELLDGIEVDGVNIRDMLDAMNRRIEVLYDREHQIGHAYFMKLGGSRIGDLAVIFKNKIIPLLQEYFHDDYAKIRMVLADDQTKNGREQFITETRVGDKKDNLFAPDADMDDRTVYGINGGALNNPASYRKIYDGIKKGDAPEEREKKPEGVGQP